MQLLGKMKTDVSFHKPAPSFRVLVKERKEGKGKYGGKRNGVKQRKLYAGVPDLERKETKITKIHAFKPTSFQILPI